MRKVIRRTLKPNESTLTLSRRGRYHIETSTLICRANQWTGFYLITASVMKELKIETNELDKYFIKTAKSAVASQPHTKQKLV